MSILIDSPNCDTCGQIESTAHFLIYCRKFDILRTEILEPLSNILGVPITVKLLLFGCDDFDMDTNVHIFATVQDYIVKSKRFSS